MSFPTAQAIRWRIADYLSHLACLLRGHRWYLPDQWHPVPGNRVADLRQSIWLNCVLMCPVAGDYREHLDDTDRKLAELAQLAGENWGHRPSSATCVKNP
jgi:hypothetical protein